MGIRSTEHLDGYAICDGCPHILAQHDGEHEQCRLCSCDGFLVSAEDQERALPTQDDTIPVEPPEPAPRLPRAASPAARAMNLENGRRARAEALRLLAEREPRQKAG